MLIHLTGLDKAGFELVAERHQLIDFGDDAVLFFERWQCHWDASDFSDTQVEKTTCRNSKTSHMGHANW